MGIRATIHQAIKNARGERRRRCFAEREGEGEDQGNLHQDKREFRAYGGCRACAGRREASQWRRRK